MPSRGVGTGSIKMKDKPFRGVQFGSWSGVYEKCSERYENNAEALLREP